MAGASSGPRRNQPPRAIPELRRRSGARSRASAAADGRRARSTRAPRGSPRAGPRSRAGRRRLAARACGAGRATASGSVSPTEAGRACAGRAGPAGGRSGTRRTARGRRPRRRGVSDDPGDVAAEHPPADLRVRRDDLECDPQPQVRGHALAQQPLVPARLPRSRQLRAHSRTTPRPPGGSSPGAMRAPRAGPSARACSSPRAGARAAPGGRGTAGTRCRAAARARSRPARARSRRHLARDAGRGARAAGSAPGKPSGAKWTLSLSPSGSPDAPAPAPGIASRSCAYRLSSRVPGCAHTRPSHLERQHVVGEEAPALRDHIARGRALARARRRDDSDQALADHDAGGVQDLAAAQGGEQRQGLRREQPRARASAGPRERRRTVRPVGRDQVGAVLDRRDAVAGIARRAPRRRNGRPSRNGRSKISSGAAAPAQRSSRRRASAALDRDDAAARPRLPRSGPAERRR